MSVSARAAGRGQPDRRLHRQPGQGHVPARRREHARPRDARRGRCPPTVRSTTRRRAASTAWSSTATPISGCGEASYDALQIGADAPLPFGPHGRPAVPVLAQRGHDAGLERSGDGAEHVRLRHRVRHQPAGHPAHVQRVARSTSCPARACWTGGWRVGGIVNARSGVPINVTINRPDNVTVNGVDGDQHPRRQQPRHAAADLVPGVDPYLKDGVRWLNPAAFATPQPGTFGNLPRNYLRGPEFWQVDLMFSKDFRFAQNQGIQIRLEIFNITNRLNYENPAATLPAGTTGEPFTDALGRDVRLHARSAQPHRRSRHRAPDPNLDSLPVLGAGWGWEPGGPEGRSWLPTPRILRPCNIRVTEPKSPPPMLSMGLTTRTDRFPGQDQQMKRTIPTLAALVIAVAGSASLFAQNVQINGAGATFPYPIYSKWFSEYNKLHPNVQINYQSIGSGGGIRQLIEPDGLLRRHRRPDDRRAAAGRARPDPAPADRARRRRAGLQHPGRQAGAEVHGPGPGRHLPRQDHEVERPGDRQAEPRRLAARHRHRRRAPLGRLGHDLHLGRLPLEGVAGVAEDRRRRRRRSTGRSASAARATRASPGSSTRRRARSATSS